MLENTDYKKSMLTCSKHYTLTHPSLFENGHFFSSLALTVYTYLVNTVNENVSFQNR